MSLSELKSFLSLILPPCFHIHIFKYEISIFNNSYIPVCSIKVKSNEILVTFEQYLVEFDEEIKKYLNAIGTLEFKYINLNFKPVYTLKLKEEYDY